MIALSLIAEVESVQARPTGPVTGNIWLEINGNSFPKYRWNDFVVVVLGWWASALLKLVRGSSTQEMVPFMEGPFAVELIMTPSGMLLFRALQRVDRNIEVATGEKPAASFVVAFILQSREILETCRQQECLSEDTEKLKSALDALAKESLQ
jgi:hypothetical protein